jgi:hypothetical protein
MANEVQGCGRPWDDFLQSRNGRDARSIAVSKGGRDGRGQGQGTAVGKMAETARERRLDTSEIN